jgi:hypothetical protein
MEIIKNPQIDFLGKAKYFVALSALLIGAGIFWIATGHLHYGVEFSGGTQLIAQFKDTPDVDKIRDAVDEGLAGRRDPDLRRRQDEQGAGAHLAGGLRERSRRAGARRAPDARGLVRPEPGARVVLRDRRARWWAPSCGRRRSCSPCSGSCSS